MTEKQKSAISELIVGNMDFNVFDCIDFIQKRVYSINGNFKLKYNSKSKKWFLKGRFITLITKEINEPTEVSASSLELLNERFLIKLEKYLKKENII